MRFMRNSAKSVVPTTLAMLTLAAMFAFTQTAFAQDNDQSETRLRTRLTGDRIEGVKPHGRAEFEQERDRGEGNRDKQRKRFSVEIDDVKLANGTIAEVDVDGAKVGNIRIRQRSGDLQVHGKRAPNVKKGSQVAVLVSGQTILSGTF